MVEGPGCTRNGSNARSLIRQGAVVGVAGHASGAVASSIRGLTLVDCLTLGKQLWLIFSASAGGGDEVAVRAHVRRERFQPPAFRSALS